MPLSEAGQEPVMWFAMSAPYRNEMKAKNFLDEKGIENFLPLQYKIRTNRYGRKERKALPVVSNLLFVHTTQSIIRQAKQGVSFLQYRTRPVNEKNQPIIVPDSQMRQFIAVCQTMSSDLIYLEPSAISLAKGARVRIIGGAFDGVEGYFVKIKGVRSRRVVVEVEGLAVATAEIEPQYIEVIKNE